MTRCSVPVLAVFRSALVGAATGSRSTSGVAACALTRAGPDRVDAVLHKPRVPRIALTAVAGELVVDKLPKTPSRTTPAGLLPRLLLGAGTASVLAARRGDSQPLAAVVGSLAAAGTSFAGVRARAASAVRLGSDVPGAIVEDMLALGLAFAASRR